MKIDLTTDEVAILLQVLPIANQRLESFFAVSKTLKERKIKTEKRKEYQNHLTNICSKIDNAYDAFLESEEYLNTL